MSKRLTGLVASSIFLFMQLMVVPAAHAAMVGNDTVIQQQDRAAM